MTPRLGTLLSAPLDPRLRTALHRLARVCELVPAYPTDHGADAATASAVGIAERGADAVLWYHGGDLPPGVPVLVWAVDLPPRAEPARSAVALLAPELTGELAADDRAVVLGRYPEYPAARPVLPFTRRRIRRARRLAGPALAWADADGWRWDGEPVPTEAVGAAAGLAAAVVALDPAEALRALAWAAPTVTDSATAAALGATDGVQLRVADSAAAAEVAEQLAADDRTAAALAWAGRRLYERRFSAEGVVERLPRAATRPAEGLKRALDELRTPADATIRARAGSAVEFLT